MKELRKKLFVSIETIDFDELDQTNEGILGIILILTFIPITGLLQKEQ
ncbi:hypothetical protein [Metabacillus fastidiosus]